MRDSTCPKASEIEWQRKKKMVLGIIMGLTNCQNMVNNEWLQRQQQR